MVNPQNLRPCQTKEEARIRGSAGGKASGIARRRKREFRKVLEELLVMDSSELEGRSNIEAICVSLMQKAQAGDVGAATWVRDTAGQKPTDKVDQQISGPHHVVFSWMSPDDSDSSDPAYGDSKMEMRIEKQADHAQIEEQHKRKPRSAEDKTGPAQQKEGTVSDDPYAPRWVQHESAADNMGQRRALSDIFDE